MVNMGTRLKQLRKDNKMTQQQLSEVLGLAISSISSYESGDRKPSYSILRKYAAYFHVTSDYILGIEKKISLDVSDLTKEQIDSVKLLITKYRASK